MALSCYEWPMMHTAMAVLNASNPLPRCSSFSRIKTTECRLSYVDYIIKIIKKPHEWRVGEYIFGVVL